MASGLCLTCLMKSGIDPHDEGPAETLSDVLDQIDIRDSDIASCCVVRSHTRSQILATLMKKSDTFVVRSQPQNKPQ